MRVIELIQTCLACPSQWEGKTNDNREIYIRYRWGRLSIDLGQEGVEHLKHSDLRGMNVLFEEKIGDEFDGVLEYEELKGLLATRLHLELPNKIKTVEL